MVLEIFTSLATYGYSGAFLASLLGSATIFLPVPHLLVIIGLSSVLDPVVLIAVSALGAGIGEMVSYYVGKYGGKVLIKKHGKKFKKFEKWFKIKKKTGFLSLTLIAATPVPTDIAGIIAGIVGYDKGRFFMAMLLGNGLKISVIVYAGSMSIKAISAYMGIV